MLFYLQCCCILNHCGNLTQYGVNATTQSPSCVYTDDLSKNLFDYTAPNTKSRDKCLSRICIESCGVKQMFPDRHEIESMPTKEGATGTFHGHITTNNKTKQWFSGHINKLPLYLFIWSLEIHVLWYLEGDCPAIKTNKHTFISFPEKITVSKFEKQKHSLIY